MALPSSSPADGPVQLEISWITVTGDKSPLVTSLDAPPKQLKLSESTPTVTPAPFTPRFARAVSERIATSPWLAPAPPRVTATTDRANLRLVKRAAAGIADTGS